jgi:ABC-type branched-subunit amino acid transport system substrate-binding protein
MRSAKADGHRLQWRWVMVAVAIMASALALAACGSDDKADSGTSAGSSGASGDSSSGSSSGSGTSTPAVKKPTGEPIKAMTIAAVNWNGPAYPNILETAKLYEKWINDRGGIKGRPLKVTVCDEQGDPNRLATCGRNAASEKDIAVVGSFTLTGDRIVPVLEKEKISWFGVCCPLVPAETGNPITFAFGSGQAGVAAYAVKAAEMGCKKPTLVVQDTAAKTYFKTTIETALKGSGVPLNEFVAIPVAAQDYSPQVAQATGKGTDCIIGVFSENAWSSFLAAYQQSGSTAKLIGPQGNLDEKVAKDFPKLVEGDIVVATYPNISDPAFQDYRDAIEQYKPPTEGIDYNSLGGLGTWTAYIGFQKVVESIEGEITNESFLAAANKMSNLDTGGKLPVLDLTKPWGPTAPEGSEKLYNRSATYLVFDDKGKLHPEDPPGFHDMTDAVLGKYDYSAAK